LRIYNILKAIQEATRLCSTARERAPQRTSEVHGGTPTCSGHCATRLTVRRARATERGSERTTIPSDSIATRRMPRCYAWPGIAGAENNIAVNTVLAPRLLLSDRAVNLTMPSYVPFLASIPKGSQIARRWVDPTPKKLAAATFLEGKLFLSAYLSTAR